MKRKHIIAAVGITSLVTLTGCGSGQQWRDLEGQTQTEPDKVRLVTNVDTYPNIVALCIEGVGFITTLLRGTEWAATGAVTLPVPPDFPTETQATRRPFAAPTAR